MKWSCSIQKAMLVPLSAPLFVVEYWSQTMICLKTSYVGRYGALRAVLMEDFNDCPRVLRSETDVLVQVGD
jgi:hypothetical protein